MNRPKSFTLKLDNLADSVVTRCGISDNISQEELSNGVPHPNIIECQALWDTGVQTTCITERIVRQLGLLPYGSVEHYTAAGIVEGFIYAVNLILPNGVEIATLPVVSMPADDVDILIGMNVITLCDFAITNVGGKTTFSFRTPSVESLDFATPHV